MRNAPQVRTTAGIYEGSWQDDIAVFRGIRFAATTEKERRWRLPEPPKSFGGVRPAQDYGPACPQPEGVDSIYKAAARLAGSENLLNIEIGPQDEDCLSLNVWTPGLDDSNRPVMVWIHGGAGVYGSATDSLFRGDHLAERQNVVVVSIHYRLGVLSYLAHPEIGPDVNFAIHDQVAALRWIQANIARFGGDPENVTIFGESAGGRAVLELMATPMAAGLFHRGIAQSPWDADHHQRHPTEKIGRHEPASALAEKLAEKLGVDVAGLRSIEANDLIQAALSLGDPSTVWGTLLDGQVLPAHPLAVIARGQHNKVPLMVGFNANEGEVFFLEGLPFNDAEGYQRWVGKRLGPFADDVLALYPPHDDAYELRRSFVRLIGDRAFTWTALAAAYGATNYGPVFTYYFTRVEKPFTDEALRPHGLTLGAFHGAEIGYAFGRTKRGRMRLKNHPLGRAMMDYWSRFAETGDPNGGVDAVPWPSFADDGAYLELGDEIRPAHTLRAESLELWRRIMTAR